MVKTGDPLNLKSLGVQDITALGTHPTKSLGFSRTKAVFLLWEVYPAKGTTERTRDRKKTEWSPGGGTEIIISFKQSFNYQFDGKYRA